VPRRSPTVPQRSRRRPRSGGAVPSDRRGRRRSPRRERPSRGGLVSQIPAAGAADADIQRIIESAERLGVSLDEADTVQWLAAIAAQTDDDVAVDVRSGTFGHRVAMLDFSPKDLARFRKVGEIVQLTGDPEVTEGALALSGSAAQSKIQS